MIKLRIEQINVSDDTYVLTAVYAEDGGQVRKGDLVFSYESSKSDKDVEAGEDGYIYFNPSVTLHAAYSTNTVIAIISHVKTKPSSDVFESEKSANLPSSKNGDRIISKKALALIEEHGIDSSLISGEIVSEEMVLEFLNSQKQSVSIQSMSYYYDRKIETKTGLAVIGAGKAALQLLDAVYSAGKHQVTVFYDGKAELIGKELMGKPIKSMDIDTILQDFKNGMFEEIIVSFSGNIKERRRWFDILKSHQLKLGNVIHATAYIGLNAQMGEGNILFAFTRVGPFAQIGDNNVLSSYCSIEHHNILGSHNTFGPTVVFSGSCTIGDEIKFGTGIFVEPNISIGSESIISSGSIVQKNIPPMSVIRNKTVFEIKSLHRKEHPEG